MGKLESAAVTAAPTGLRLFSRPRTIVEETTSGANNEQTTCFEEGLLAPNGASPSPCSTLLVREDEATTVIKVNGVNGNAGTRMEVL